MAEGVNIPITLDVTDLDISKVDTKSASAKLSKEFRQLGETVNKAVKDGFNKFDASDNLKKSVKDLQSSYDAVLKSKNKLHSAISDVAKTDNSAKSVDAYNNTLKEYNKTVNELFKSMHKFEGARSLDSAMSPKFKAYLNEAQRLQKEMTIISKSTESLSKESGVPAEAWAKADAEVKATESTVKSLVSEMREMVKTGDAFKTGMGSAGDSQTLRSMLNSISGKSAYESRQAKSFIGENTAEASIIAERTELEQLNVELNLAKSNLEALSHTKGADPIQIKEATDQVATLESRLDAATDKYYGISTAATMATQEVTATAQATEELASSATSAESSVADMGNTSNIDGVLKAISELTSVVSALSEQLGAAFERSNEPIERNKKKVNEFKQALDATRNVTAAMMSTLNSLGSVGSIISQLIGIVQLLADAFRDVATASNSIIPIIGIFVGLAVNLIGRLISILKKVLNLLKRIATAIIDVAKKITDKLASAVKGLFNNLIPSGNLLSKVKRFFTQYLLGFRSSYFLIRKIRQAVIDGMKEIAAQAPEVNAYMGEFSTALNQVKGSLVGAFEPILSFVLPILTRLLNVLAQVLTKIAQFNAVLLGRDHYYDYAANMVDYASGIDGVGKAAKKAQRDLMGFDEINRLSAPNEGSGSGGSGYGGTFTKSLLDEQTAISKFAEMVKEAWKNADFTEVGQVVGDKLNSVFDKLDEKMPAIKTTAQRIATSLATFINGFVATPELGSHLGRSIAELFDIALNTLYTFATTVDWAKVGTFIGDGISSFLSNFDWAVFFGNIVAFLNGLATAIVHVAGQVDWAAAGKRVAEGLTSALFEFDAATAGKAIHDFFMSLFEFVNGAMDGTTVTRVVSTTYERATGGGMKLSQKVESFSLGDTLTHKIKQFIETLNTAELGETAGKTLSRIITEMATLLQGNDFIEAVKSFADAFTKGMEEYEWKQALEDLWNSKSDDVMAFLSWLGEELLTLADIVLPKIFEIGEKLAGALVDGMKSYIKKEHPKIYDALFNEEKAPTSVKVGQKIGHAWANDTPEEREVKLHEYYNSLSPVEKARFDQTNPGWADGPMRFGETMQRVSRTAGSSNMNPVQAFTNGLAGANAYTNAVGDVIAATEEATDATDELETSFEDIFTGKPLQGGDNISPAMIKLNKDFLAANVNLDNIANNSAPNMSSKVTAAFSSVSTAVGTAFAGINTEADKSSQSVIASYTQAQQGTSAVMSDVSWAMSAFNAVTAIFNNIPIYFEGVFTLAIARVRALFEKNGDLSSGINEGLSVTFKSVFNTFIDGFNNTLGLIIDQVNVALSTLKMFNIGGTSPFAKIPKIPKVRIPKLAQGAVLPPNQPFLSIVGDQKSGTNIEAPLETIKQAVAEVTGDQIEAMLAGFEAVVSAIQDKRMNVIIGDRAIGEAANRYNANQQRALGV